MAGVSRTYQRDPELLKVGEKESDEWYAGVPTTYGSTLGTIYGAPGYMAGPIVGTITSGIGGLLGGWAGSFFEPEPEDIMVEEKLPPPKPYEYTPLQGSSIRGGSGSAPLPMVQQYGVEDPYGFGWG